MPIITATRVTVSIASEGWFSHHSSVFAMLSMRTFLFGSDSGRSLSHLLKARPARVGGMCWDSHGLSVVVPTSKEDGSKLSRRCWTVRGPHERCLDGCGRRTGSRRSCGTWSIWCGCVVAQLLTKLGKLASELCKLVLCLRISCTGWNPAMDEVCDLLRCILGVLSLVQELSILSGF